MHVKKRTGALEPFDIRKVGRSLANASDEIHRPLNEADLRYLCTAIHTRCSALHKDVIDHREIRRITTEILTETGFSYVAQAYNAPAAR